MRDIIIGTLKSKTFWVNVLVVLVAALGLATKELALTPEAMQVITFLQGLINIVLRVFFTVEPVTSKAKR